MLKCYLIEKADTWAVYDIYLNDREKIGTVKLIVEEPMRIDDEQVEEDKKRYIVSAMAPVILRYQENGTFLETSAAAWF